MFGEGRLLLDHPDFVADTWLNLASATWFYTTPQPPPTPPLHQWVGVETYRRLPETGEITDPEQSLL